MFGKDAQAISLGKKGIEICCLPCVGEAGTHLEPTHDQEPTYNFGLQGFSVQRMIAAGALTEEFETAARVKSRKLEQKRGWLDNWR